MVQNRRNLQAKGKLSEERKDRLDALGVDWDLLETQWEAMFQELVEYKKEHGHCNVPKGWKKNPQFGTWVGVQRKYHGKGKLSEERKDRLDALGVDWDQKRK